LRNGDRPTGKEIAEHLAKRGQGLCPARVSWSTRGPIRALLLAGGPSIRGEELALIWVARKTARLTQLQNGKWKRSPLTDAMSSGEFMYQPEGLGQSLPIPGAAL